MWPLAAFGPPFMTTQAACEKMVRNQQVFLEKYGQNLYFNLEKLLAVYRKY
jgi:hypothetical protein